MRKDTPARGECKEQTESAARDSILLGPGLSMGDVPSFYPLQAEVHLCHDVFWTPKKMAAISWKSVLTHVFFFPIDTTWHMHRRKTGWTRGLGEASIRTGPPYASRHADWYLNPSVMSADMQAYSTARKNGRGDLKHALRNDGGGQDQHNFGGSKNIFIPREFSAHSRSKMCSLRC